MALHRISLRESMRCWTCMGVSIKFPFRFPQSVSHGIQALDDGLELLLLFSDGNFDATGTTFMLSDLLVHTQLEIFAQNLGLSASDLQNMPQKDPYTFENTVLPPQEGHADEQVNKSPDGEITNPYVLSLSQQPKEVLPGGWIKIQDSTRNFKESWAATAYVYVEPNGLRELHWHPDEGTSTFDFLVEATRFTLCTPEWLYVISGNGRATAFSGGSSSSTFELQAGDSAVFPNSYGHYVRAPISLLESD
jgi:oxalate decarboxylase